MTVLVLLPLEIPRVWSMAPLTQRSFFVRSSFRCLPNKGWADQCRRAAHAVKGAAANLMCHEINHAAAVLEARSKEATTNREFDSYQPPAPTYNLHYPSRGLPYFFFCCRLIHHTCYCSIPYNAASGKDLAEVTAVATKLSQALNRFETFVKSIIA